jgi:hypothetical protein
MVKHPAEIIPTVSPGGMKFKSVIETPPRSTAKWDHWLLVCCSLSEGISKRVGLSKIEWNQIG